MTNIVINDLIPKDSVTLEQGGVFFYEGELFMMTEDNSAVNLENGELTSLRFWETEKITKVSNLELIAK
jgi:hypothetical protein